MEKSLINYKFIKFIKNIDTRYKLSFVMSIISGFLVHVYMYTNVFLNQDGISHFFRARDTFSSGRWFLGPLSGLFSDYTLPWLNGVVVILSLGIITCFIVNICQIKSYINIILISLITVTFPNVTATNIYMFVADAYLIAIMFAVISVYFVDKGKYGSIISIILLVLSTAVYQINIFYAVALYSLKMLRIIINNYDIKIILKKLLKYILVVIISLVVYLIINKLIIKYLDIALSSYKNINTMGNIQIKDIPLLLKSGIREFFKFFFVSTRAYTGKIAIYMNAIVFGAIAISVIKIGMNKEILKPVNKILLIALIVISPLVLSLIYLLDVRYVHHIMMISFVCVYYIAITLMDFIIENKLLERFIVINNITIIAILIVSISWAVFANKIYIATDMKNKNMYAYTNRLVQRIESFEGYNYSQKVAIIGNSTNDVFGITKPEILDLEGFTGVSFPYDYNFLAMGFSYYEYIRFFVGVDLNYPGDTKEMEIGQTEEFKNMPIYPDKNSMKKFDDVLVIKISEYIR